MEVPTFGDLTPHEVRVLGCLVEKEATTPASYPLTRNALQSACNQSTSRDPVLELSEQEVEAALLSLRDRRLARPVRNPGDRVTKFRHAMPEVWEVEGGEAAVLAVLLLRGAQTVGELRSRTARLHEFVDVADVAGVLVRLADRAPSMVAEQPRGPGQKEARWVHLAGARDESVPAPDGGPDGAASVSVGVGGFAMARTWRAGARAVLQALSDPLVAAAWDRPSVLEAQAVSSLAGHLARGAVWVVGDYLDREEPTGEADVASAGGYFADLMDSLTDEDHAAVRDRGAAVAAVGHDDLVRTLGRRVDALAERVPREDPDRLVEVIGGRSIRLEDYLATRVVEQVVHLDDLVRSVDGLAVDVPTEAVEVAELVGLDVLRHRHGPETPIRVLYRREYATMVPVL